MYTLPGVVPWATSPNLWMKQFKPNFSSSHELSFSCTVQAVMILPYVLFPLDNYLFSLNPGQALTSCRPVIWRACFCSSLSQL
jgi:hypothetical protein